MKFVDFTQYKMVIALVIDPLLPRVNANHMIETARAFLHECVNWQR